MVCLLSGGAMRFSKSTAAAWPAGCNTSVARASCASRIASFCAAIRARISAATSWPARLASGEGCASLVKPLRPLPRLAPLAGPP